MQAAKFFGAILVGLIWLYAVVIELPLLLTAGGVSWLLGVALVVLSVTVPAYMVWKIFKGKTKTTSNKE
ncbi:hypothetical protein [Stenotrophomonas phage BUCTxx99]|nr:hypothetical protein [Stenotrophomonas phage BUCTxx99]